MDLYVLVSKLEYATLPLEGKKKMFSCNALILVGNESRHSILVCGYLAHDSKQPIFSEIFRYRGVKFSTEINTHARKVPLYISRKFKIDLEFGQNSEGKREICITGFLSEKGLHAALAKELGWNARAESPHR